MASEFTMICVANKFPYKGHADLFSALFLIQCDLPPWRLLLAGRGTEYIHLCSTGRTIGLGISKSVPALLKQSDLFILPSHGEGSSNALLEAMAAGVPIIATDVGGNSDAITHGETGILVPPKDPRRLAAAILWMTERPNRRREMARMAQLDAILRFSMERCIDDYEALYGSIR